MVGTLRDTHLSAAMNISVEMTYPKQQNQVCAPNPVSYEWMFETWLDEYA
jgi:hypothetical protein